MRQLHLAIIFAALAFPTASAPAQALTQVEKTMLNAHNRHRAAAGLPPFKWDAQLAADAKRYSAQLAKSGRLAHSAPAQRPGQGENLAAGTASVYSPAALINQWAAEKRNFKAGTFPNVSRTGNWGDVAHYTQMIWPTTTHVGCGVTLSRGVNWLVCRYRPPGNVGGTRVP